MSGKKKKESEGIALLSMYYDEEEDEDMDDSFPEEEEVEEQIEENTAPLDSTTPPPLSIDNSTPYQSSELFLNQSQSQSDAMNITEEDEKEIHRFLPPPPNTKCSDELQKKITKFLSLKEKTCRSYNSEVRNRKEYRNPDFLLHAVTYQDIDQIGSCFSKDVFDPHGYARSDYYDDIEADLKRELERKEQERKKSQKIDILSGGTQSAIVIPTPKVVPIPAVPPVSVVSAGVEIGTRESRPNKKSKWDKVDVDTRHPLTTGAQDPVSTANAGSGYTTFAQQRRKEAEDRRSSDMKLDRRS